MVEFPKGGNDACTQFCSLPSLQPHHRVSAICLHPVTALQLDTSCGPAVIFILYLYSVFNCFGNPVRKDCIPCF